MAQLRSNINITVTPTTPALPVLLLASLIGISGCQNLPNIPHLPASQALTERVNALYQNEPYQNTTSQANADITEPALNQTPTDLPKLPSGLEPAVDVPVAEQNKDSSLNLDNANTNNYENRVENKVEAGAHIINPNQTNTDEGINTDEGSDGIKQAASQPKPANPSRNMALAIAEQKQAHPNLSGYYPIITGAEAFASRSILTGLATKNIDVQYYIWKNDQAGQLLLQKLWQAAEQGVLVRLLLDDFNSNVKLDQHLLRFASHPNIAVRVINPMMYRNFKTLNYLTGLPRINRRMHNKSMTFDRQITVIGGRNIGNEYLSNDKHSQFADLDVLLVGDVVDDISSSFERYWSSDLSYDIETLVSADDTHTDFLAALDNLLDSNDDSNATGDVNLNSELYDAQKNSEESGSKGADAKTIITRQASTQQVSNKSIDDIYEAAISKSKIDDELLSKQVPFKWTQMQFLSDDVDKLSKTAPVETHLVHQLRTLLGKPTKDLTIISSYFVPTTDGVDVLMQLANQGVNVRILTNSFNATDVAAVHSGYSKWRAKMLKAGIKIYELKSTAAQDETENKLWRARSQSATSLHAKTFAVDDYQVFIGSYNVDPRSANINTEMGVLIRDDELAKQVHAALSDDLLSQAYEVLLKADGTLQWQTIDEGKLVTYDQEPKLNTSNKIWITLLSWLPIDWLL